MGIVEVKSNISSSSFLKILEKSNRNGSIIVGKSDMYIFNGIFSYNIRNSYYNYIDKLEENDFPIRCMCLFQLFYEDLKELNHNQKGFQLLILLCDLKKYVKRILKIRLKNRFVFEIKISI